MTTGSGAHHWESRSQRGAVHVSTLVLGHDAIKREWRAPNLGLPLSIQLGLVGIILWVFSWTLQEELSLGTAYQVCCIQPTSFVNFRAWADTLAPQAIAFSALALANNHLLQL